jgi:RimJ/RimL family protein N-acetyltransferase
MITPSRATSVPWGASFGSPRTTGNKGRSATTGSPAWPTAAPSGGIGFKGRPEGGGVEIGYGLAPSARGHGYAAEAVVALLGLAANHGLSRVIADATVDNLASQRTLLQAGFDLVASDGELHRYEFVVDPPDRAG